MELYLSRGEIRRRVLAILGFSSAVSSTVQSMDQLNEFINEANDETMLRRKWVRQEVDFRFTLGIDQYQVAFPSNWGPESISELGVWDANVNVYVPIPRRKIVVLRDTDPLRDVGGDIASETARRGRPVMYEPGPNNAINFWPPADIAYDCKLKGFPTPQFVDDSSVSIVDGRCIILWAAGCMLEKIGDLALGQIQRQKFENRLSQLHAWQQTGEAISLDSEATFDDERWEFAAVPRYDFTTGRAAGI